LSKNYCAKVEYLFFQLAMANAQNCQPLENQKAQIFCWCSNVMS